VKSATVEGPERTAHVALNDRGATAASSLLVISRAVFDRALLDAALAAGARLVPEKAVDIAAGRLRMIVTTDRGEYEVDQVLGADGANSIVRKKLARPFSRSELSVAAGYFVSGRTACDIIVKTTREQPGYLWSFPRPDHLAVGVCAPATHHVTSVDLRAQSAAWIQRRGFHSGAQLTPYAWPIPSVGCTPRRHICLGGAGWMLLGDAAGLVDPLTREGIYYALVSGQRAAEALARTPASRALSRYAESLFSDIQPELARAARLRGLFFNPGFSSLLVKALEENGCIRDIFVDLVGGLQPYRGLRRRLLTTLRWSLAARAIPMLLHPGFTGTMNGVAVSPGNVTRS
jgi:flavin-dependent dehydrogenase